MFKVYFEALNDESLKNRMDFAKPISDYAGILVRMVFLAAAITLAAKIEILQTESAFANYYLSAIKIALIFVLGVMFLALSFAFVQITELIIEKTIFSFLRVESPEVFLSRKRMFMVRVVARILAAFIFLGVSPGVIILIGKMVASSQT
jgi:hypothetical protein